MGPVEAYQADLNEKGFTQDPAQFKVVAQLDDLYRRLMLTKAEDSGFNLRRALAALPLWRTWVQQPQIIGIYLWGGVGVGKTYLMDKFYDALELPKQRLHFHRFMRQVHEELAKLQGQKNPLTLIAKRWALQIRVLCLDEFFVSDITDAMILAGLLETLFDAGVVLVTTSNIPPNRLYANGLQRSRFEPAIDLLLKHTQVLELKSSMDFRLRTLEQAEIYHSPLNDDALKNMAAYFEALAPDKWQQDTNFELDGRLIDVLRIGDDVLWVDFNVICGDGRSQRDYIEIAKQFHAVLISGIPQLTKVVDDKARRFILLVDEFYDRNLKLIVSAQVPVRQLYVGSQLVFEFERTQSRLIEMQSHAYLAKPHQP